MDKFSIYNFLPLRDKLGAKIFKQFPITKFQISLKNFIIGELKIV
jgi:hypothetical protein